MNRLTYFDEELGSYLLTEENKGDKLDERDLINIIGDLEDEFQKTLQELNFYKSYYRGC